MGAAAFAVVAAVAVYGHHPKVDRTPGWGYCQVCDRETPHLGIRCAYTSSHAYITGYWEPEYDPRRIDIGAVTFVRPGPETFLPPQYPPRFIT